VACPRLFSPLVLALTVLAAWSPPAAALPFAGAGPWLHGALLGVGALLAAAVLVRGRFDSLTRWGIALLVVGVAGLGAWRLALGPMTCEARTLAHGISSGGIYRFAIETEDCQALPLHRVLIGPNDGFEVGQAVLIAYGSPVPVGVRQSGPHQFDIILSGKGEGPYGPLRVRMEPATGEPIDRFVFRRGKGD